MRGRFEPCKSTWCGGCFVQIGKQDFPIAKILDEDGKELEDPGGRDRFLEARNGDHLMVPFQCKLCHFRNIFGREAEAYNHKDKEFFVFARRANLDAFWSREPPTVKNNLKELVRMKKTEERFGFECTTPPIGPFPVKDSLGMKAAIAILDRSLDKGSYGPYIQWATFRKLMGGITNTSQASVEELGNSVGAYERNKMWISTSVSHQFWFSRFMVGIHKRVGEVKKQDEAFTIDIILEIKLLLDLSWTRTKEGDGDERRRLAELGVWFMVGFCCGLRGKEMLLIELAGTRNSLADMLDEQGHFKVVISGRTKGNQVSGAKFSFPCVHTTQGNGLNPGVWIRRLIQIRSSEEDNNGRLFFRGVSPARLSQYEADFYDVLYKIQANSNAISDQVEVADAYGILRSLCRGATVHARNMKVSKDVIEAVHRWRREAFGKAGGSIHLDLIDVYTALDALAPTLLDYSRSF